MTGEDILDMLHDAREDGDYVLITPYGHILVGSISMLSQSAAHLALLEQLPTEGVPRQ